MNKFLWNLFDWLYDRRRGVIGCLVLLMNMWLAGLVFHAAWQWFVADPYGLPPLLKRTGGAFWLTIRMIAFSTVGMDKDKRSWTDILLTQWAFWIFLFLTFWVLHFFR